MSDSHTDVFTDLVGRPVDYRNRPLPIFEPCERVSDCCFATLDETDGCQNPKCREHNGASCRTHDTNWPDAAEKECPEVTA